MTSRRIAHFELHELLGEGAMGKVYRAIDLQLDRPVAIKVLGSRTVNDPAFIDRFKREARLAAQLNHPNIATIYAFGEEAGETYIAMEFVEGETLTDRLSRGPLPMALVRKFGRQAAAALATAHEKGIVHRDIKPGNLMVNREGELKVMDFGVARRSGETEMTMAGSLIGTANIMAPELVRGETATPAADLFSLGCVLYEMLTGRPAFEGDTALAILFQVANHEPAPLENLRSDTPADLRDLVTGLLIKDPTARFGPARAVAERLAEGGTLAPGGTLALSPGQAGTMVLPSGAVPSPGKARKTRLRSILGGVILVALLASVGIWIATHDAGKDRAKLLTEAGERALGEGKRDSALTLFEEAVKADAGYAPAWNNLGLLQFDQGQTPDAIRSLEKAVEIDEKYDVARLNLADVYRLSKQPENIPKAESFYSEVIAMGALTAPKAYWGLARLKEATDPAKAVSFYQAAIAKDPSFAAAYNDLGYMFVKVDHPDSAEIICREGIRRFRNDPEVKETVAYLYKNLGDALLALRKYDGADSAYVEALTLKNQKFPLAVAGRARVAEALGNREGAIAFWELIKTDLREAEEALLRLKNGG